MTSRIKGIATLTALALVLAGCSGGAEEPAAQTNVEEEAPLVENMGLDAMVPPVAPSDVPTPTPTASPEPIPEVDRLQVQDDADATGMTSRVERSDGADNTAVPVDQR